MRAADAKGVKTLAGKPKPQGRKSRLDGQEAAEIRACLQPWASKRSLGKGDLKDIIEALDSAGIKSLAGTKLSHTTAKMWWQAVQQ